MFRTRLPRQQAELFGADALGVDVRDQRKAGSLILAQAEVRDLDILALVGRQHDPGPLQILVRFLLVLLVLFFRYRHTIVSSQFHNADPRPRLPTYTAGCSAGRLSSRAPTMYCTISCGSV